MKKLFFFILIIQFSSCQYFENQVPSVDRLYQKRITEINWNAVDTYPSVSDCENLKDKTQQKQCFFEFLSQTINEKLNTGLQISKAKPKLDSLSIKVTILQDSTLQFEPQFIKDSISFNFSKIDSVLHARLIDFPKIIPATKHGIPVKCQFILPIKFLKK